MFCLRKNKQKFFYQTLLRVDDIYDDDGNFTGEVEPVYDEPIEYFANISAGKGDNQIEVFGTFEDYTKVIVVSDLNCPIDENTVLFIDTMPHFDNGELLNTYDYIVTKKSVSLNVIAYAIKKVR